MTATRSRLILASASRGRAALLRAAGYRFMQAPADIDETLPARGVRPRDLVALACRKADAAARRHPDAWVIGADTAVLINGTVLGKPGSSAAAVAMLERLAGRTHRIVSALCVIAPAAAGSRRATGHDVALVRLRDWDRPRIERHVRRVRPTFCAGAYALQGGGAAIVEAIEGDPSTVIGLPLAALDQLLARAAFPAND